MYSQNSKGYKMIKKHENKLVKVLNEIEMNPDKSKFFGMTYEQGIESALMWVLGEIEDEDFEYTKV